MNIENQPELLEYLRARSMIGSEERPLIHRLEGGVSNRVVSVRLANGQGFVLKQALEKLRVQVDWFCTPARIDREALALIHLAEIVPPGSVPKLLFHDPNEHLLAMEEVPQPHENWKQMLLSGRLKLDHVRQFAKLLAYIHRRSADHAQDFAEVFGDRSFFETLRLEPYYRYTACQVTESAGFMNAVIADTLDTRLSLVHGDFSPKNVLIHQNRLVLLDYEVVHFGDPGFDIGFSLAHFLGKANHVQSKRREFTEAALLYWRTYAESIHESAWIKNLEPRAVRHSLACSLARVAGRSPLEYLTREERKTQETILLDMIKRPPDTISTLINSFVGQLPCQ